MDADQGHSNGSQAERRARSRNALLESAARNLSRFGYGNLVLDKVAVDAGYTRGALYHQFADKQDLTLATLEWVRAAWIREIGQAVAQETEPVAALLTLARRYAVLCRRDFARMPIALRVEFSGQDHPIGREIDRLYGIFADRCAGLVDAGRRDGSIPVGPPVEVLALALVGVLEGIGLAGLPSDDELVAARAVAGVLGVQRQE